MRQAKDAEQDENSQTDFFFPLEIPKPCFSHLLAGEGMKQMHRFELSGTTGKQVKLMAFQQFLCWCSWEGDAGKPSTSLTG